MSHCWGHARPNTLVWPWFAALLPSDWLCVGLFLSLPLLEDANDASAAKSKSRSKALIKNGNNVLPLRRCLFLQSNTLKQIEEETKRVPAKSWTHFGTQFFSLCVENQHVVQRTCPEKQNVSQRSGQAKTCCSLSSRAVDFLPGMREQSCAKPYSPPHRACERPLLLSYYVLCHSCQGEKKVVTPRNNQHDKTLISECSAAERFSRLRRQQIFYPVQ